MSDIAFSVHNETNTSILPSFIMDAAIVAGTAVAGTASAVALSSWPISVDEIQAGTQNAWEPPTLSASTSGRSEPMLAIPPATNLFAEWYYELSDRIDLLARNVDGWKGPNSVAADADAVAQAQAFLAKLSRDGIERRPSLGLDFEGTLSFSWIDDDVQADLTIYGDGTYSFFAAGQHANYTVDEASLDAPIDARLVSILLG